MPEHTLRIAPNFDLRPVVGQKFMLETKNTRSCISVDDHQFLTLRQHFSLEITPDDEGDKIMDWMQLSIEHLRFLSAGPEAPGGVL